MSQENVSLELTLNDAIINFFMNNKEFYDKSDNGYCLTPEKLKKLADLRDFLHELGINITVTNIIKRWEQLKSEFKKCYEIEKKNPTGSAAKEQTFPYYKDMLFLIPALQHREAVSTMNYKSTYEKENIPFTLNTQDNFRVQMHKQLPLSHHLQTTPLPAMPGTSQSPMPSTYQVPQISSHNHQAPARKMPPYDDFANKKLKLWAHESEQFGIVGKAIVNTLDCVGENLKKNESPMIDYTGIIRQALEKVTPGCEDECLQEILNNVEEYEKQLNQNRNQ